MVQSEGSSLDLGIGVTALMSPRPRIWAFHDLRGWVNQLAEGGKGRLSPYYCVCVCYRSRGYWHSHQYGDEGGAVSSMFCFIISSIQWASAGWWEVVRRWKPESSSPSLSNVKRCLSLSRSQWYCGLRLLLLLLLFRFRSVGGWCHVLVGVSFISFRDLLGSSKSEFFFELEFVAKDYFKIDLSFVNFKKIAYIFFYLFSAQSFKFFGCMGALPQALPRFKRWLRWESGEVQSDFNKILPVKCFNSHPSFARSEELYKDK